MKVGGVHGLTEDDPKKERYCLGFPGTLEGDMCLIFMETCKIGIIRAYHQETETQIYLGKTLSKKQDLCLGVRRHKGEWWIHFKRIYNIFIVSTARQTFFCV